MHRRFTFFFSGSFLAQILNLIFLQFLNVNFIVYWYSPESVMQILQDMTKAREEKARKSLQVKAQ